MAAVDMSSILHVDVQSIVLLDITYSGPAGISAVYYSKLSWSMGCWVKSCSSRVCCGVLFGCSVIVVGIH